MFIISRPGRAEEEKTQFSRTFTHHFQSMIIIHGASFVTCILPPLLATNASCLATPRYSGSSHSWRQSDFRLLWCSGWKSMKGDRDRRGRSYLCDILSGWEWVAGWMAGLVQGSGLARGSSCQGGDWWVMILPSSLTLTLTRGCDHCTPPFSVWVGFCYTRVRNLRDLLKLASRNHYRIQKNVHTLVHKIK